MISSIPFEHLLNMLHVMIKFAYILLVIVTSPEESVRLLFIMLHASIRCVESELERKIQHAWSNYFTGALVTTIEHEEYNSIQTPSGTSV